MEETTVHEHARALQTASTALADTEEHVAALAQRLADRLARAAHHSHELRLARALMFDVIELLEAVSSPC